MEGPHLVAPFSLSRTLRREPALSSTDKFPDQLHAPAMKAEFGFLFTLVLSIFSHLFNTSEKKQVHITLFPSLFISVAESKVLFTFLKPPRIPHHPCSSRGPAVGCSPSLVRRGTSTCHSSTSGIISWHLSEPPAFFKSSHQHIFPSLPFYFCSPSTLK